MTKSICCVLLISLSTSGLASVDNDAVNERPPVNKQAMEAHWQVNCADTWHSYQHPPTDGSTPDQRGHVADLLDDMQLCAYIYQPPGEDTEHQYPDYRGAVEHLEQGNELTD